MTENLMILSPITRSKQKETEKQPSQKKKQDETLKRMPLIFDSVTKKQTSNEVTPSISQTIQNSNINFSTQLKPIGATEFNDLNNPHENSNKQSISSWEQQSNNKKSSIQDKTMSKFPSQKELAEPKPM